MSSGWCFVAHLQLVHGRRALAMRAPSSSGTARPSRLATTPSTCCTSARLGAATRMHRQRLDHLRARASSPAGPQAARRARACR